MTDPAVTGARTVVGAALVREARVLACRRTTPPAAAGRWALPGGKVEPGETPEAALVREVAEELGIDVAVVGWLDGAVPIAGARPGGPLELRVAHVRLADPDGWAPHPVEHDRLRWLAADRLDAVDWLEPDRPFLPGLRAILGR